MAFEPESAGGPQGGGATDAASADDGLGPATARFHDVRILMYSHDTFGLGHLRRCRAIAHALVENFRGVTVLIISGAPIAGAFDYRARVDFVKIPSVIKLRNGEYTSLGSHIALDDTLMMRRSIIRHTAETFRPDIFIADKEPMGLQGEIEETLTYLKTRGTRLVLGLREVMDAPHLLDAEWRRGDLLAKIEQFYDNIWIYGPENFHDPLAGLGVSAAVRSRMNYVGFLERHAPVVDSDAPRPEGPYLLVTTGGGGDGAELIRDVIAAYRAAPQPLQRALFVLGPYLPAKQRAELAHLGHELPGIEIIEFDNRMEHLIAGASAVVGMGGYNTFCEILSFDKPALIIPRVVPREEQLIRARRGAELGLVQMMMPEEAADAPRLAEMLRRLPSMPRPSDAPEALRLNGLCNICADVGGWLKEQAEAPLSLAKG